MWLNISVLNNSPVVVTALQGTDTLPAGMTIASDPQPFASAGCGAFSAANFSAAPGGGSFGFSLLQIPAFAAGVNGVCEVYVRVQVTGPTGAAAGSTATLNNQILVGGVSGLEGVTPVSNTSSAAQTIQVTKLQNLTVAKSFSPTTVRMGETSSASITITNPNAARTVELGTITENLPASLSATNTPSVVCSGGGTPSVATPMGGSFPNLTFPSGTTMAGSGTCTITFTVLAAASNGTNSYTATNTVPAGGVGNSRGLTSAVVNTSLTVQSPLLTSKSFSPNPAGANAPVTMTITLQNRSAAAISALAFTDNLPAPAGAMTVLAPGGATAAGANPGGCSAASAITAVAGTALVAGAAISVPANSTCAYTVPVSVSNDGSYANTITNVTYTSADADVGVMTGANASATLTAYDQITATKAGQDPRNPSNSAGSVAPGNRIVYRVAISNYSLGALTDVQVTDPLPLAGGAQVTYVSSIAPTVSGASCSGPTSVTGTAAAPVFNGISVPAGSGASPSTCTLEFTVQVPDNWPANTAIVNTIPAGNITYNGGGSALQGAAVTDTRPYVDRLTIAKSVAPTAVFQGDTALVTVTLVNNSFNDMTGAGFTDSPLFGATNAVRVASAANPATTCGGAPSYTYTAGGSSFAVSGLTVPQRGSCTVSFRVLGVVPGGPYTNTIPAANAAGTVDNGAGPVTFNAAAAASASLTVNSVLNVGKSFSPSTVVGAGGVSRVSLTLQNVGVSALTNLGLSDPLPAGLAVANPAEPSTTCGGTPVVTAAPGAASVSLTGVTLYAATTCLVQFNVVSSVGTASVNTIAAGNVTADNGVFNASPASATLNKIASPGVNIGKAFSPAALAAVGSTSRLTVTVQNSQPGSVALTDLAFTDNMPAGMVIAPTPNAVSSCAGAVLTALPGASAFSMSIAALPSGASCVVALNVTLIASGSFVNTLPAGVVTNAQGVTNSDPFSSTLATLASLGVDKSFSPAAAAPGTPVLMRIRLINTLASAVSNLAFTDNLPAGLTPSTPSALSTTCVGASVSATSTTVSLGGGSLAAGSAMAPAICEVSLLVQSSGTGSFTNTIAAGGVTGTNDLGAPVSNNDPASAVFRGLQPVVVSKAFSNGNRVVGQVNRLTVTLANPNTSAISNVGLADPLPAGVYVATVPNASTTCASTTLSEPSGPISIPVTVTANAGATVARIAGATVAAGSSCEFAFDVVSHALGTWTNVIPEGSLTSHEGVTNANPASAPFTTLTPPTLGKQFSPVQIASGGSATLRISLGNPNASAITLTSALVDNLPVAPSQMRLSASTPLVTAQTTCTLGSITAAANATSVTYASGASIPAGGCVIAVNVTGTVEGTYNNVIAAGGLQTNGGPSPQPATANLSITNTLASIGGRVYRDHNNNGSIEATDVPLAGVTIELLDSLGAVVATTTTDTLGGYTFLGLAPGTYSVRQPTQPAGTFNGITTAGAATPGGSAGTASAVGTTPSAVTGIVVAGGQSSTGNHFGEVVPSRLSGRVFLDANNNGSIQAGESGLGGVSVVLTGTDDLGAAVSLATTTASDGSYAFTNLRPGSYTLTEGAQAPGTANGITTAGPVYTLNTTVAAPGGASGTATAPSVSSVTSPTGTSRIGNNGGASVPITLPPNAESVNNNFGEIATNRSISGRIFTDLNNDGLFNTGDTPIAGQTVTLTGTDASGNAVSLGTTVAADGSYAFTGLAEPNGSGYTVSYDPLVGSPALNVLGQSVPGSTGGTGASSGSVASRGTISGIALGGLLTNSSNNNFTQRPPGSISGRVFLDADNNGAFDPPTGGADAGLSGVQLVLTGIDHGFDGQLGGGDDVTIGGATVTATTAADGSYTFANLRAGSYTVTEPTQPANTANGITTAGPVNGAPAGTPGTATAVGTTPSAISTIGLAPGANSPDNLFAEVALVSISGTVFVDANRNDVLDGSDAGRIPGTTVTLVRGASCAAGTVIQTTTTDASGNYSFANVPADGAYRLCQTQPVGYGNGASIGANGTTPASNEIVIAILPVTGLSAQNFAERPGSLAGSVYQDQSAPPGQTNNGLRDAGELGIANVPVTLTGTDARGAAVNVTVLTDAAGNYLFEGLVQANTAGYTITEGAIPGASGTFNDGIDTLGNASVAAGSNAANDSFTGVRIAAAQQASGYLFGELPIAPISGAVYIDSDRNNALDAGDALRIAGVTLTLYGGSTCSGTVLQTQSTDAAGNYSFSGVSVGGTYSVCQTQPAAWGNGNASGVAGSNQIVVSNLALAGSAGNHFGELPATVAGSVFLDAANNGTRDGADTGLAGVVLTLSGTDIAGNTISRGATTDAAGNFFFNDLPAANAGGYTVTEQSAQPVVTIAGNAVTTLNGITTRGSIAAVGTGTATGVNAAPSAVSAITLGAGAQSIGNLFAEIAPVALSGRVFIDANNNGAVDPPLDAGISGVSIVVTGTDDTGAAVSRTLTTDANGNFAVADLRPGTYTVTEPAQPAGTSNGRTTPGTGGGTGTPITTVPSAIAGIVLTTPGAASSNNLFGEIPTNSSISGRVFADASNDGLFNGSESGLGGVTIELTGTDLAGQTVTRSTTSNADGTYTFANLPPGSFTVTEPTQPAGTVNGITTAGATGGTATAVATVPSAIASIPLGINQASPNHNFAEVPGASIAGRVFSDSNNNGVVDGAESGIAAVTLVLTGTDDLGNAVNRTLVSDAAGNYSFDTLRPGTYTVTEPTQPPDTVNGITTAGSIGGASVGNATAPAVTPSAISTIVLPPGAASVGNNFAEIGNSPDLKVTKTHSPAIFTTNNAGTYTLTVRNLGQVPSTGAYTVSDRLPTGITLAAAPTGTGWVCTGAAGASSFSCTSSAVVANGATNPNPIIVPVNVAASAAAASPVQNVVMVDGGGELDARRPSAADVAAFNGNPAGLAPCTPTSGSFASDACRQPTPVQLAASITGTTWFESGGTQGVLDAGDRRLPGWTVEVVDVATNTVVRTTVTDAQGNYRVGDLIPGVVLAVRFRDPANNVVFGVPVNGNTGQGTSGAACNPAAALAGGSASSCVERDSITQLSVVLRPGENLPQQSLPVDPSGVVYDATTRRPVPGSVVTLAPVGVCTGYDPATSLVNVAAGGYGVTGNATSMTVGADGFYQFLFSPSAPASCTFALTVTPPAGYSFVSTAIPPQSTLLAPPGGPTVTFAVQPQAGAPAAQPGVLTTYHLTLNGGSAATNIIHNHIPLDPTSPTGISIQKQANRQRAEIGETVLYTITIRHTSGQSLPQVTVRDRAPAGFTYIAGTARVNGTPIADPIGAPGPVLGYTVGGIAAGQTLVLTYRMRVGVGAAEGDGINRARGHGCGTPAGCLNPATLLPIPGSVPSNEAQARVRVEGGVFGPEAHLLGKIFVDCNRNSVQDAEELGIPGVRLYFEDGSFMVSDSEGKYSMSGLVPRSHTLKVDPLTLPRGSRLTTSSNRNLGDANSLFIDLKRGELHRADFIEGSCSNTVLEQVKARRAQGEVRSVETERRKAPPLRFESKPGSAPQQATDGANQAPVRPRPASDPPDPKTTGQSERDTPVPALGNQQDRDAGGRHAR
ncbi:MAG: SdrD B-like domain-containing protein [Piscinibacter sp.]|uniref:SdrD B-like domain-containing protein n=1 Tax=Piscinibacter sp. TaxID=1903157 RepID=UPI003D11377D